MQEVILFSLTQVPMKKMMVTLPPRIILLKKEDQETVYISPNSHYHQSLCPLGHLSSLFRTLTLKQSN